MARCQVSAWCRKPLTFHVDAAGHRWTVCARHLHTLVQQHLEHGSRTVTVRTRQVSR